MDGRGPAQERPGASVEDPGRWVSRVLWGSVLLYAMAGAALRASGALPVLDALFFPGLLVLLPALAVGQAALVPDEPIPRIPVYAGSAAVIMVLGLGGLWLGVRSWGLEGIGLRPDLGLREAGWALLLVAAGVVVLGGFLLVRRALGVEERPLVVRLLPRSSVEGLWFGGLSIVAGFGEEVAYRGYAMAAMMSFLPSPWGCAVLTSVSFGLLHAYQGPTGVIRTGTLGLVFAASVLVTESVWPAMVAHAAIDLLAGLVLRERLLAPVSR